MAGDDGTTAHRTLIVELEMSRNRTEGRPIRRRMQDSMTDLLWILALQLAARRPINLDLETWPASYRPRARA